MARRNVDSDTVVWFAPETLNQTDVAEKLAAASTVEETLEILAARPTHGEYRVQTAALVPVPGPDGTTVLGPEFGERVVWIDDEPDDRENGAGHFEVYDTSRHGDEYKPIIRKEA